MGKTRLGSDEKVFRVRSGEQIQCWLRHSDSKYSARYVRGTVAHPQSLMVWAAMDASGTICLRRCPERVNASKYQDLLETALPFIRRRCVLLHCIAWAWVWERLPCESVHMSGMWVTHFTGGHQ